MHEDNGILARVRGTYVADGAAQLPPAGPDQKDQPERTVTLHEPVIGQVRITYRLNTYAHRRSRYWHWLAVRADLVSEKPPAEAEGEARAPRDRE